MISLYYLQLDCEALASLSLGGLHGLKTSMAGSHGPTHVKHFQVAVCYSTHFV